jgi:hypothetical protein
LTIPMYVLFVYYIEVPIYPLMTTLDWQDVNAFSQNLYDERNDVSPSPQQRVWQLLPEQRRAQIADSPLLNIDQQHGLIQNLNAIINDPKFYQREYFQNLSLPENVQAALNKQKDESTDVETATLNRMLLVVAFPNTIKSDARHPYYNEIRWIHDCLYALAMWLLVFGFLGLFLYYFNYPSKAWRYIADSSYWLYLIHLPIVCGLQVIMAYWNLHWSLKFPLLMFISLSIMFLSYHYLVRSTFIGATLNGRKHPFTPLFRKTTIQRSDNR